MKSEDTDKDQTLLQEMYTGMQALMQTQRWGKIEKTESMSTCIIKYTRAGMNPVVAFKK